MDTCQCRGVGSGWEFRSVARPLFLVESYILVVLDGLIKQSQVGTGKKERNVINVTTFKSNTEKAIK